MILRIQCKGILLNSWKTCLDSLSLQFERAGCNKMNCFGGRIIHLEFSAAWMRTSTGSVTPKPLQSFALGPAFPRGAKMRWRRKYLSRFLCLRHPWKYPGVGWTWSSLGQWRVSLQRNGMGFKVLPTQTIPWFCFGIPHKDFLKRFLELFWNFSISTNPAFYWELLMFSRPLLQGRPPRAGEAQALKKEINFLLNFIGKSLNCSRIPSVKISFYLV